MKWNNRWDRPPCARVSELMDWAQNFVGWFWRDLLHNVNRMNKTGVTMKGNSRRKRSKFFPCYHSSFHDRKNDEPVGRVWSKSNSSGGGGGGGAGLSSSPFVPAPSSSSRKGARKIRIETLVIILITIVALDRFLLSFFLLLFDIWKNINQVIDFSHPARELPNCVMRVAATIFPSDLVLARELWLHRRTAKGKEISPNLLFFRFVSFYLSLRLLFLYSLVSFSAAERAAPGDKHAVHA